MHKRLRRALGQDAKAPTVARLRSGELEAARNHRSLVLLTGRQNSDSADKSAITGCCSCFVHVMRCGRHGMGWADDVIGDIDNQAAFPIGAKNLANLILDWAAASGVSVSPMKLQKLVYFCHADFLLITGQPLIYQEFEAWDYGPVIPSLFQEFKHFGAGEITGRAVFFDPIECKSAVAPVPVLRNFESIVRKSFQIYSKYTASDLSNLSHSEEGPWSEALRRFNRGTIRGRAIDNSLIAACHRHPGRRAVH